MNKEQNINTYDYVNFKEKFVLENELFPAAAESGFRIFKIEEAINYVKFPLPLHRTSYYDILYMKKGSSTKNCGLQKYTISERDVFFKRAGQITSGDVFTKDVQGYFCLIEKDFISSSLGAPFLIDSFPYFKYGQYPIIGLDQIEEIKFDTIFLNLYNLFNTEIPNKKTLLASWLNVLFQEANSIYQKLTPEARFRAKSNNELLVGKYKDLISQHFISIRSVSDYADMLSVTPNHLNRVVKSVTGSTATSFINEMLLLEAKVLLIQTMHTVSEIALRLKFNDASHFNRFFKKHCSLTPLSYRKKPESFH